MHPMYCLEKRAACKLLNRSRRSAGDVLGSLESLRDVPETYSDLLEQLEDQFCTPAYINASVFKPAAITGQSHHSPPFFSQ